MKQMVEAREELPPDSTLFLSVHKPHTPVLPQTLGNWMRTFLKECGINGKAHGVRGQASSAALYHGAPLAKVLQSANWASESTFRKYYYVPATDAPSGNATAAVLLTQNSRMKQQ